MLTSENSKQTLQEVIDRLPKAQIEIILSFAKFIENQSNEKLHLMSEKSLAKDWLLEEENSAWENL